MTQATQTMTLVQATAKDLNIPQSYLQLVKDVYAKNATDEELALFLRTANRLGLDPTARQIYLVKRWDSGLKREVATPQVSIDGFRAIADRTDKYVPGREAEFAYDGGNLLSATAFIKKYVGGEWHEISATAFYSEYVQKTKEGRPNSMWARMPHLMLAKCAESLVLRKAFPAELSGIYTSEEMGHEPQPATNPAEPQQQAASRPNTDAAPSPDAIEGEVVELSPERRREEKIKEVQKLVRGLNAAGDSVKWTPAKLKDYVNELFDVADGLDALDFAAIDALIADLEVRLDDLKAGEAEQVF